MVDYAEDLGFKNADQYIEGVPQQPGNMQGQPGMMPNPMMPQGQPQPGQPQQPQVATGQGAAV